MGDEDEFEPDGVGVEVAEREVGQAAVFGGADAVLDPRAGTVLALERGDLGIGLIGEDGLEAVPVVIGERELCAGVRTLAARSRGRLRASR